MGWGSLVYTRRESRDWGTHDHYKKRTAIMAKTEASIFDRATSTLLSPRANAMLDLRSKSEAIDFSYEAIRYPLGFPIRILSNSAAVINAADWSWKCFYRMFEHEPLELRVAVKTDSRTGRVTQAPIHSQNDHLIVHFADAENYFVADLAKGQAMCWVTKDTVDSTLYLRYHMLEAAALCMITTLRAVAVHGACVIARNKGILLCGDSGAGKSTLAYAGARSGWTYVTDDASYALLDRREPLVVGNCHQVRFRPSAAEFFPEIRGYAITPRAAGKPSIEARTSQLPAIRTAPVAMIDHIITLNRNDNADQELVSLPPAKVLPWFMQYVMATPASRETQEAAISRLLRSGVFELRYHDLNWAIERINLLAEDGRC